MRTLTKSRFKLASECPAKLYCTGKKEYANQSLTDSFLASLAEGGFQVGELAKCYYPGGTDIVTLDYEDSLRQTNELLQQDDATIYEAAIKYKNLFIRIDVLVKRGKHLELIEVKAKSFDPDEQDVFLKRDGTIASGWHPYLADVAFQKYVLSHAFPRYSVSSYLMMADKTAECSTDGLNQKFRIVTDNAGRKHVLVSPDLSDEDLSEEILCKVNVDPFVDMIRAGTDRAEPETLSFEDRIFFYADHYERDEKIVVPISKACASCEFRTTEEDDANGLKSGFRECWSAALGWTDEDFKSPTVLDIWNFRKKDQLIEEGRIRLTDVNEDDIGPAPDGKPGISSKERQWLQVRKSQTGDDTYWIDRESLRAEMDSWVFPLHFIDFETSMAAIPFNRGRRPYEGIAFQFSHHLLHEDGRVQHKGQFLNTEPGVFPNYEFIRALKTELEGDNGTIFRYAAHENTYLNIIYRQLQNDSADIPDREDLYAFILSITQSPRNSVQQWIGERNMVDMLELVKRYYYDPLTGGSNSIKYVLPAVLNRSGYLQEKYGNPIYGAEPGIPSLNFTDWQWIEWRDEKVRDPYELLPKLFQDVSEDEERLITLANELRDGGAALTAYARMQFEEMSAYERDELSQALLKYCELDTLAMVMIYEGWREFVGS